MEKVSLPNMLSGDWRVEKFTVDRKDWHSELRGRGLPFGDYTRLTYKGKAIMSDTPAEMRDHKLPVIYAKGHCLINGLGLGMLLKNILLKDSVTKVTVVELSKDVINMVGPHYIDPRVEIIQHDAYTYQSPKGIKYQMVWHDIWGDLCADNLEQMKKLHRKYGRKTEWQASWCRYECEQQRARGW